MLAGTLLLAASAGAQLFTGAFEGDESRAVSPSELFTWTVEPQSLSAHSGDTVAISVALSIPANHYVYAERTSVTVGRVPGIEIVETKVPEPVVKYDTFEKRDVAQYTEPVVFRVFVRVEPSAPSGLIRVPLTLRTQGCSRTMCFFPMTTERDISIAVASRAESAQAGLQDFSTPGTGSQSASWAEGITGSVDLGSVLSQHGIVLALVLMFVGGLLTSLTPCVYPLIPITVSFFGATKAGTFKGFLLSLVFVLGMATMYSILGVSAAATGSVFGAVMANPVVIGGIALIFVAFALSMFGAYKIQLPSAVQARLQTVGGSGWGGAFLAGVVAGIIAAPCTGPVLGAALTYVATTGDLAFGFFTMFTFAIGMGMLFIAIGTFSARIVPRSGAWLGRVESVFGIALLVVALYFLKDVIPSLRDLMRPGTGALLVSLALIFTGLAVGAVHKRFASTFDSVRNVIVTPSLRERVSKGLGVVLVVAGLYGAIGAFLMPSAAAYRNGDLPRPDWVYSEADGIALARMEGLPVVIDAYADWCVACRELDAHTFSDPRVLERLSDFVAIKLDFTSQTAETRGMQRKYGIVGLPTVIFLDSSGNELTSRRLLGFESADRFLARLEGIE